MNKLNEIFKCNGLTFYMKEELESYLKANGLVWQRNETFKRNGMRIHLVYVRSLESIYNAL